jgi:hypothetical protein
VEPGAVPLATAPGIVEGPIGRFPCGLQETQVRRSALASKRKTWESGSPVYLSRLL